MKTNQIKPNLNEADIGAIADLMGNLLDKQTAVLATKEELRKGLAVQTSELKTYIHEGIETVMDGMTDLENRLDVHGRVDKLEKDVKQLKLSRV